MNEKLIMEAKPHTIKKFEIISNYVDSWARKILGNPKAQGVVFIDCMSSSGYYHDLSDHIVEGTGVRVAKLLNDIMTSYPGKNAWLYFNDISEDKIKYLNAELNKLNLNNIFIRYNVGDCNEYLKSYKLSIHRDVNTLLIYDPFEASIDWDAISPFFKTWGEVIINHMISDTTRGAILATRYSTISKYENTYRKPIEEILSLNGDRDKFDEIFKDLIREQTSDLNREYFIASFPFYNRNNGQVYCLVFCSSNVEGLKLYKKVAWRTFGDKSSLKNTHGDEMQYCLDLDGDGDCTKNTDEHCYYVQDIAKYIYDKYYKRGVVYLKEIYDDLDRHPIFPSDGYKDEIKKALCNYYGATIKGKSNQTIVFNSIA